MIISRQKGILDFENIRNNFELLVWFSLKIIPLTLKQIQHNIYFKQVSILDRYCTKMLQKPSNNTFPAKKQLIVIFFLTTTLFVGAVIKAGVDYHWWLPETEIISYLNPEDIKIKLDVNKAPWYELVLLPKLGEVKAKAIVIYREKYGDFKTVDELAKVNGIGASIIDAIRDHIKTGSDTASVD